MSMESMIKAWLDVFVDLLNLIGLANIASQLEEALAKLEDAE